MLGFHGRKPAAAAHDAAGAAKAAPPRAEPQPGAADDAPALLGRGAVPGDAAAAAAPADNSAAAPAAAPGASGPEEASAAPPPRAKTHRDVAGGTSVPAVKQRVMDDCFAHAAHFTAVAAAASDPARRNIFNTFAEYCDVFPAAVVSECKRAQSNKGGEARAAGEKLKFPRADLKARCQRAPAELSCAIA
jgi:hypothetical protein